MRRILQTACLKYVKMTGETLMVEQLQLFSHIKRDIQKKSLLFHDLTNMWCSLLKFVCGQLNSKAAFLCERLSETQQSNESRLQTEAEGGWTSKNWVLNIPIPILGRYTMCICVLVCFPQEMVLDQWPLSHHMLTGKKIWKRNMDTCLHGLFQFDFIFRFRWFATKNYKMEGRGSSSVLPLDLATHSPFRVFLQAILLHHTHPSPYHTVDFAKGLSELLPNTGPFCRSLAGTFDRAFHKVVKMLSAVFAVWTQSISHFGGSWDSEELNWTFAILCPSSGWLVLGVTLNAP